MRVIFSDVNRPKGLYLSGVPGTGKSSLIEQLVYQDFTKGHGVCVIDPTRDLVPKLIHYIPEERKDDCIYFDSDFPIPIDFFSYRSASERQVLTDQLLSLFTLGGAPISRPRLRKLLGTLFDANEKGGNFTFLDIAYFIERKSVRNKVFEFAPQRRKDWPEELFKTPKELAPIYERMGPFIEPGPLPKILGRAERQLNIWDVMQQNKILLVNLKDTETDLFIGALICAKIQQATFGRAYIPAPQRTNYYLYIDECHTILAYAVEDFEKIITRARKYKLCLTLANQFDSDVPEPIRRKLPMFHIRLHFDDEFRATITTSTNKELAIRTPKWLRPTKASHAEYIQRRTVDTYACNTKPNTHTEGNAPDYDNPGEDRVS